MALAEDAPTRIRLFAPCLASTFRPTVVEAARRVLEHLGLDVALVQGVTCCGQPAFNAGLWDEARRLAQKTIAALEAQPGPVVVPAGSCAAMMRKHYLTLFADDPAWLSRAQALSERVFEFSEFLVRVLGQTRLPQAVWPGRVTYHASCHLRRELGVDAEPKALLDGVEAVQRVPLPEEDVCCGFGGVFSSQHPDIAMAIGEHKVHALVQTRAHIAVTADPGCLLHIAGVRRSRGERMGPPIVHLAEFLDAAIQYGKRQTTRAGVRPEAEPSATNTKQKT
ncbi:MAG: (Fe-S)-binding protein [Chloroflexi bacterium]|nr:(Fe-S)-binding protein [Chloroflexota bacterium]